jgi:putative aldouronate transport system permease protein
MIVDKSLNGRLFDILNYTFLILLSAACLLPMVHILAVSLSDRAATAGGFVTLWPINFTIESYRKVIQAGAFWRSFQVSVARTTLGTLLALAVTILTAYPLSKTNEEFRGRKVLVIMLFISMVFSGGLIPFFLVVRNLGLLYKLPALFVPFALSTWNVIILMNFFRETPKELEDAGVIDGASHWQLLYHIYLPLALPALATLALFAAVWQWNDWFWGMIFMRHESIPLQTFLRYVVIEMNTSDVMRDLSNLTLFSDRSLRAAQIFVTTLPILVIYPILQRYFVSGIKLGAVKG